MDHSCTELGLVSGQPEGVRARPAPGAWSSCPPQDPREGSTGNTGEGQMLPDPALDTQSPEKNTARGLFLIAVSGWYTDEPGSGNIIEIKYKNPPLEPGVTKPQLGTARLFLWFDAPGCPAGPPHLCPSPGVSPGWVQLAHGAPRPSPLAGWASQRHGLFWGGNRGMLGARAWERH